MTRVIAVAAVVIGAGALVSDQAGAVTTVAGVDAQPASDATHLNRPAAVLVHAGWLWIADLDNHRICAVNLKR